ncbi:3-deoxy-manno-octulosonate cytidylyltransferase (CMP-KDO synthetase) [Thalassovita gelatinovora]|uniref:3-deoxy-manno-octulosonate cytidylyltransferase n=1 Tax=Thalassovita gelatinovora TaxID=53501 RepID=UPI0008BDAF36|nr:manno-octulosonate cytidylyltransferase [Thalassovita gelatinovora]QIZ82677.1 3-deoxy-manno-octulosonate cytidylyltransferase [Thalassovita gelatinovora]SER11553.1 3-deoxy-manno-octulosonate cytidylyltransferase (CMP-KDO synthetase) [Thalassovita gelatinovora]
MKTVILIPARYASTRYPGKPLAELTLPSGEKKSLIRLSWEAANRVKGVAEVHVVTDDDRIRDHAKSFGASVIMTSAQAENGTARCAEALDKGDVEADLVINLQGDAPLTPEWFVEDLIDAMTADEAAQVATPVLQCDALTYGHFIEDRKAGRVGGTTAVFDARGHALYFSKEVLPYIDPGKAPATDIPVYHHVGVYAYRPAALRAYRSWPVSQLETLEGLEQLRFLVNDTTVRCVIVEGRGRVFWELNNPEDVPRINSVLKDL